jgi:hypothetical protein
MRSSTIFSVASWIYLAIAAMFGIAIVFAPWLTARPRTAGLIIVAIIVIAASTALGLVSRQIAQGKRQPSRTYFIFALLPVSLGALSPGFAASLLFGLPFSLVAWGTRKIELKEPLN